MAFTKTEKQVAAIDLMIKHSEVLLEGGSRSGKTFIAIYAIIARALKYPNSRHLIVRKHFNHVKNSIWYQTLPQVKEAAFIDLVLNENRSDWFISLANGSQIWIAGTDDKERIEKILGTEWDTIYLNEASQMSFDIYETLKTRLNPSEGIKELLLIDYNPPNKKHWGYVVFHNKLNYDTKLPLDDLNRYGMIRMNPEDNMQNLSKGYLDTLNSMSESKRKRYLRGEYSDDTDNALWNRKSITENRLSEVPKNLISVIIAVDPSVTSDADYDPAKHDMAGIVVCAKFKIEKVVHYCVLDDCSVTGMKWGKSSVEAYKKFKADKIIAEKNQGGELVKLHIRNESNLVPIELVHASRGKEIRATPIADLYERGLVHHVGSSLDELEDELCTWVPGEGRSPNRLDSLVWGITYLSGKTGGRTLKLKGL